MNLFLMFFLICLGIFTAVIGLGIVFTSVIGIVVPSFFVIGLIVALIAIGIAIYYLFKTAAWSVCFVFKLIAVFLLSVLSAVSIIAIIFHSLFLITLSGILAIF